MTDFKRIPPEQAQTMRSSGAVIVDIRDPHSYANGHISGSLHLDNHSLPDFIAAADLDQPLIVTCYHGHSSQRDRKSVESGKSVSVRVDLGGRRNIKKKN